MAFYKSILPWKVMIFTYVVLKVTILHLPQSNDFVHIWCQMHFTVMISLAFAFKVMILHIWCQMHFKVMISLAFAFKVTVLHICGAKSQKHFKVMISLAFAFKVNGFDTFCQM